MNQKLIEELRNGEIALSNSGTFEQLEAVLKAAFPDDCTLHSKHASYKYFYSNNKIQWCNSNNITSVPTVFIHKFFEETVEFVWGEEIKHNSSTAKYYYIGNCPIRKDSVICIDQRGTPFSVFKKNIEKISPVLELTLQEIADKFGKPVHQIRIKDGN